MKTINTLLFFLLLIGSNELFAFRSPARLNAHYSFEAKIADIGLAFAGWYTIKTGIAITQTPSHAFLQKNTIRYLAQTLSHLGTRLLGVGIAVGGGILIADGVNIMHDNHSIINYRHYINQIANL